MLVRQLYPFGPENQTDGLPKFFLHEQTKNA